MPTMLPGRWMGSTDASAHPAAYTATTTASCAANRAPRLPARPALARHEASLGEGTQAHPETPETASFSCSMIRISHQ